MIRFPRLEGLMFRARRWAWPWVFIAIVVAASNLPLREWAHTRFPEWVDQSGDQASRDTDSIVRRAGGSSAPVNVDVVRIIDGDTFVARVHLDAQTALTTRVRLRDIDATELKAACPAELRSAETARAALRDLLSEGAVTITRIGADKYAGRIDAVVATRRTPDVSAQLLARGLVRAYHGGQRQGWCDGD